MIRIARGAKVLGDETRSNLNAVKALVQLTGALMIYVSGNYCIRFSLILGFTA